jgi:hypothetical protein
MVLGQWQDWKLNRFVPLAIRRGLLMRLDVEELHYLLSIYRVFGMVAPSDLRGSSVRCTQTKPRNASGLPFLNKTYDSNVYYGESLCSCVQSTRVENGP